MPEAANQTPRPYTKDGKGKDACPSGSFCLYADVQFNTSGSRTAILVIPEGATANNFSDYGFDHSGDGVSAVVNNTTKGNVLFNKIDQQGEKLPVDAGKDIPDLTKCPLKGSPDGTWNDQAQSALAAPKPVPPPVITDPKDDQQVSNRKQPISGTADTTVQTVKLFKLKAQTPFAQPPVKDGKWSYTPTEDWSLGRQQIEAVAVRDKIDSGRAYRTFYVTQPKPTVEILHPGEGKKVGARTPVEGIAFNADKVDLKDNGTALSPSPSVTDNKWSFTPADGWTVGAHTVTAVAVKSGTQEKSDEAKRGFTVEKKNLTVGYEFTRGPWQEYGKYVYSYKITMTADKTDVKRWRLGFEQLPAGCLLYPSFVQSFWGMIIEDGTNGRVQLGSPAKGTYIVPKGQSLSVQVQVMYPTESDAYKKLYGLYAEDWSGK